MGWINSFVRTDNYLSVKEAKSVAEWVTQDSVAYSMAEDLAKGEYYVDYKPTPVRMSQKARNILQKAILQSSQKRPDVDVYVEGHKI